MRFENDESEKPPRSSPSWVRARTTGAGAARPRTVPYCDGSHAGSEYTPLAFTVDEPITSAICSCGLTSRAAVLQRGPRRT